MTSLLLHFPQNTSEIISNLKASSSWKFDTKVILIFSHQPRTPSTYSRVLQQFSSEGLFNVAIYHHVDGNLAATQMILQNPFHPPSAATSLTTHSIATTLNSAPTKFRDLTGHEFVVLYKPTNWISSDTAGQLTGIDSNFIQILMRQLNATYRSRALRSFEELWEMRLKRTTDLIVNIVTINNNTISDKFERIFIYKMDTLGILVTSNRIENAWELMLNYFRYSPIFSVMVLLQILLLNWLILGRSGWRLLAYNAAIPWALSQPGRVGAKRRRGAKIFSGAIIWFDFVIWLHVLSTYTSKSIAFLADRSITSKEQLLQQKIPIYTDRANKYNLEYIGYDQKFLDRVQVYNGSLWEQKSCRYKCAYIEDMILVEHILNSATNLNEYGEAKYYKLKDLVLSLPLVNLVPANSPFRRLSMELLSGINESGLESHWIKEMLFKDPSHGLRFFKTDVEFDKFVPQRLQEIWCVFILLGIGLALAAMAFLGEVLIKRREVGRRRGG